MLWLIPIAMIVHACGALSPGSAQSPVTLAETGRVYALVTSPEAAADIQSSARALGYAPGTVTPLGGLGLIMVMIDLPGGVTGPEAIDSLEAAVPGSTVGVNHAYRLQASGQVTDRRVFANDMLNWPAGGCRAMTRIGLIDSAVNTAAPALSGVKIRSRSFASGTPASARHGTEVATVLAHPSRLRQVTLVSADVISRTPTGESLAGAAALVQAIDWMARQGVRLVNISLAGPPNKLLSLAIETADQKGVVLVAAAGNNGPGAPAQYPAAHDKVIAVTAVDARSRIYRDAVRGDHIDIAAPGVDLFVGSAQGGRYVTGTSMAAPLVTAQLAAGTARSKAALIQGALDLGPTGKDAIFGHGLLQAPPECR